jgi:hypothetical protein
LFSIGFHCMFDTLVDFQVFWDCPGNSHFRDLWGLRVLFASMFQSCFCTVGLHLLFPMGFHSIWETRLNLLDFYELPD